MAGARAYFRSVGVFVGPVTWEVRLAKPSDVVTELEGGRKWGGDFFLGFTGQVGVFKPEVRICCRLVVRLPKIILQVGCPLVSL